jgi:hypothetical protein
VEIACDESGYEGEKLIGTTTDVFAHASVRLDAESATSCMQELRRRIRSPATEYKANHLLREKHRKVLCWLLGPSAPLFGHSHVYLVDKAFFVVSRVVGLLLDGVAPTADLGPVQNPLAVTLYRDGQRVFGREAWRAFLVSSNNLMRAKDRLDVRTSVEGFFRAVEALRLAGAPGPADDILAMLCQARPYADSFRTQLLGNATMIPAMDPLIPALVQAVVHWGDGATPVSIVHDRQNTLSDARIEQLKATFSAPGSTRLASLSLVNSYSDPRVQIADILAGAARKIASDELNNRGDAELTAFLRPYVDPFSIWGDDRSWPRLAPTSS